MYIYYVKSKDSVIVQNSNMNYEIFSNTNNIENVLESKNNIEIISNKINDLKLINDEKRKEELELKMFYLSKKQKLEENKLDSLIEKSSKAFSSKKINGYVNNYRFIKDLDNKLKLIDFYLEIRYSIINHEELNIKFNKNENQKKKLKFLNMCFSNINTPESFIESLIKKDSTYSINKQKKLKYEN